jgi:outer membrane receptor protein involved in Fe transport
MNKTIKMTSVLFLAFCMALSSGALWAQGNGILKGKVLDDNEKLPLPTVKVTVMGTRRSATTNSEGDYTVRDIPPGTYKVVFELAGFQTETRKDVVIPAGRTLALDVLLRMGFANEVTVTARREVESLQNVPQNVEVLTATKLNETPLVNVVQVLNNVIGVDVESGSGSTAMGTFIYIDGYNDDYIRKMVDGVDVGQVVNNWSMLNSYPEDMVEQIEVVKGGSSAVWGSNMGGIINVITKRPRDMARPMFTFKTTYASFGAMDFAGANAIGRAGSNLSYSANILGNVKKLGYMFGYDGTRNDGFVQYGRERNSNIFGKLSYDFSDKTFIDFLYNGNTMDTQFYSFLNLDDMLGPDFPFYWNYKAHYLGTSNVASLRFSTYLTPAFNVETQLKFNRSDLDATTEYLDGSLFQPPAGTLSVSKYVDQKMGFTIKGSYTPGETLSLVSGIDYYRIKADFSAFVANQPIIYVDSVAPFVNAEVRVGDFGLHAGARYDYDSSFGSQLSPSLGATFHFLKASLFRVNVARTFKVPPLWYTLGVSFFDQILPNPALKPERAWAYSAGFESQELRYLYVKLSFYYHKMTDGIVQVPADLEGRFTWGNISQFTKKGYEAEFGFLTPFGLTGYIGSNYNKHEDTTGGQTALLTWIPTHTYKTGLKYKNEKWDLMANLRGRWIWWNMDPSLASLLTPRDKKWVFDFRMAKGFKLGDTTKLNVFIDVFNLTDQAYWDRSDMPNPRRWGQLGLEVNFK